MKEYKYLLAVVGLLLAFALGFLFNDTNHQKVITVDFVHNCILVDSWWDSETESVHGLLRSEDGSVLQFDFKGEEPSYNKNYDFVVTDEEIEMV